MPGKTKGTAEEQALPDTLGSGNKSVISDNNPINEKWLDPDYKLSKDEIKQAKQIIKDFNKNQLSLGVWSGTLTLKNPRMFFFFFH